MGGCEGGIAAGGGIAIGAVVVILTSFILKLTAGSSRLFVSTVSGLSRFKPAKDWVKICKHQ